jgi:GntR family transcriptional regulator/MocR family aminotransferase
MPRHQPVIDLPALSVIDRSEGAIGRQLTDTLRNAISRGEMTAGERLPSTRALAKALGVSRGTITEAYAQLVAEGCLDAKAGSSTRVARMLPLTPMPEPRSLAPDVEQAPTPPASAAPYASMATRLMPLPSIPFSVAVPEGAVAMDDHWRRLSHRVRQSQGAQPSGYGDPRGLLVLREQVASYVRKARAVHCGPENIIITEGAQQGLYIAARVLLAPGDAALAEDPAYPGLIAVLEERGIEVARVPVDNQGFDIARAHAACPRATVAFVTPSHQYPMGVPLSMPRRLALLEWARRSHGWIVEDDYDSELRYAGYPFPAIQGLGSARVVYLGTFSKLLAPSLRLGYVVAPDCLVDAFVGARALLGRGSPLGDQHVIAAYMKEGHFEAHIRRIRTIYAERRKVLTDALQKELPSIRIQQANLGMHVIAWLPEGMDDVDVARAAAREGIALRALSPLCASAPVQRGLILGFGGFNAEQLREGVSRLRRVLVASGSPAS